MNYKKQIRRLLALEVLGNLHLGSAAWVLLLVGRGFSLVEVGLVEAFFHVVSLCCEVPSGMVADLLGRRRTLAVGHGMWALSALMMMGSNSLMGVCLAMGFSALGYNLASGTREAITYDSLLQAGQEEQYLRISSLQNVYWRLSSAVALLCAGLTVILGYRISYGLDMLVSLVGVVTALGLIEPIVTQEQAQREQSKITLLPQRIKECALDVVKFLKDRPHTLVLMLGNALVGACATLLGFYLQDALPATGVHRAALGPLLLGAGLGGVVGSRFALSLEHMNYRFAGVLCVCGVAGGFGLALTGQPIWMAVGGFLATACDDAFELITDSRLNAIIPSDRRATLISVSSMTFSFVMIVLSPLGGYLALS